MPTDSAGQPKGSGSESLVINGINGNVFLPGERRFEIRNASAELRAFRSMLTPESSAIDRTALHLIAIRWNKPNASCLREFSTKLKNGISTQPRHRGSGSLSEADVNDYSSLSAKFSLLAKGVGKNEHLLRKYRRRPRSRETC